MRGKARAKGNYAVKAMGKLTTSIVAIGSDTSVWEIVLLPLPTKEIVIKTLRDRCGQQEQAVC